MPVHWVVQRNQGNPAEVEAIVRALEADDHAIHLVPLQKGSGVPEIPELPDDAPIVCHGAGFVTRALGHPRFGRGLFFDPAVFRWSVFRSQWPDAMLSQDGRAMPLYEALAILQRKPMFVRPDEDSKAFDGGVYQASALHAVPGDTAVVVASPIQVDAEWRFFVVNREIVGCSQYRRHGQALIDGSVPHSAIELAAECAQQWGPADVYCLDLAASGDRVGIVEANCFNASRFYGAPIDRVLGAVNRYVLRTS